MPTHSLRAVLVAAVLSVTAVTGCRSSILALGSDTEGARRNAGDIFDAFALRFDSVQRDSSFDSARRLMARYALIPSRLFADTSVWTIVDSAANARAIFVRAFHDGQHYRFIPGTTAPYPAHVGDERHFMRLEALGRNDFRWTTSVDHAIGHVRPGEVADAIRLALSAADGRVAASALADARATFPSAGPVLARLLRLDSLNTSILGDGSTIAVLGLTFTPDELRGEFPAFARYLDKYVVPSVYSVRFTDHAGATYFDMTGRDGSLVATVRSRAGHLLSLDGGLAPLPDSLLFITDFSAKYGPFRVGYTDLVGDFTIERGEHEASWMMRWRREPAWHFPLAFDKLIRNPLRRPFEDDGIELRLGVRDDLGAETMSIRRLRFVVNESGVMRWLGGLGATAFGDFSGRTESEENRFLQLVFAALGTDVRRLQ